MRQLFRESYEARLNLKAKYTLAVGVIAFICILTQLIVQYALYNQAADANIINLSGRQGMLSERIVKYMLLIPHVEDKSEFASHLFELKRAHQQWDKTQRGLKYGDEIMQLPAANGNEIYSELEEMEEPAASLNRFISLYTGALEDDGFDNFNRDKLFNIALDALKEQSHFLIHMNHFVFRFSEASRDKVQLLRIIEVSLFLIMMIALFLEVLFIFRPAIKTMRRQFKKLEIDAVELQKEKEIADHATASKSEFLANMAHEIRTPIHGILGVAEVFSQDELSPKQFEYIDLILFSGRKLLTIVNEILDFSKLQVDKIKINNADFCLETLIESIRSSFSLQADAKGIQFSVSTSDNLPRNINSDDTRIFQILNNVIGNAIKFTLEGTVNLHISRRENINHTHSLIFVVQDTGMGIERHSLDRLFVPFEQANDHISKNFGGTGLGLSIVKMLLDLMGGTIEVQSEIGKGSCFTITIPFSASKELSVKQLEVLPSDESFKELFDFTFLVVDDDLVSRKILEVFLVKLGYNPEFANSGSEAIEALSYKRYDIIIMDMQMPQLNGPEAAEMIRRRHLAPDSYIIALTANESELDRSVCIASGMNSFISKPIRMAALKKVISEYGYTLEGR